MDGDESLFDPFHTIGTPETALLIRQWYGEVFTVRQPFLFFWLFS